MKNTLIFFAIVAAIGFFTNPKEEDFKKYLNKEMEDKFCEDNSRGILSCEKLFANIFEPLIWTITSTNIRDYKVCTIYELKIVGSRYSFIGVFGTFFPISENGDLFKTIDENK